MCHECTFRQTSKTTKDPLVVGTKSQHLVVKMHTQQKDGRLGFQISRTNSMGLFITYYNRSFD